MELKLHRACIQSSGAPVVALAEEFGVGETTVRRWRSRTTVTDRPCTPRRLPLSLSAVEEQLVVELRGMLALSQGDTLVMRRCVRVGLSRSAIHRCLARHGINRRPRAAKPPIGTFEDSAIGFIHIDLEHLTRLAGRPGLVFVTIDRATRFVHIAVVARRDAATVAARPERLAAAFPHEIRTVLTERGRDFADCLGGARWRSRRRGTGRHHLDRACAGSCDGLPAIAPVGLDPRPAAADGIERRLTRPFRPRADGVAGRLDRRLGRAIGAEASLARSEGKTKVHTHERDAVLRAFAHRSERTRRKCLGHLTPAQAFTAHPGPSTSQAAAAALPTGAVAGAGGSAAFVPGGLRMSATWAAAILERGRPIPSRAPLRG